MNSAQTYPDRKGSFAAPGHFVQFYEELDFLYSAAADYLADGLSSAEPMVVITTPAHRRGFSDELNDRGFDVDAAVSEGKLTFFDARQTLESFMSGNMPDAERFNNIVGGMIEKIAREARAPRIRAFGEMVDLLWQDGNPEAAIRLEELWNELGERFSFSLLCAYRMGNFVKETATELFEEVCRRHEHVVPAESFPTGENEKVRAREISLLQQRAAALETEITHRKQLEKALRDALSARRIAEEALRRSESDLRDFIENATIGLHWIGADGRILWANRAELSLLGYSREEYIGHHISEFHADQGVIAEILRRLRVREELHEYEARLIARDGSIKTVAINSNGLFENGRFVRSRCFTRDITDGKRVEADNAFLLEASTVLNRSLDYEAKLRELTGLIVPRLAEWCAIDISRDGEHHERIVAHSDLSKVHLVPRAHDNDPTRRVLATGTRQFFENLTDVDIDAEFLKEMQQLGTRSLLIVPMKINERILGAITLGSAGVYNASDLALATEFGRRAAEALENARLYRMAQESNRIKDEFLATLSHELRTPLTAILGWARLLTIGIDAETTHTAIETIERSARTQASLIDDLLDLSRIVTGKLALQSELVDLGSVLDNALQTIRLAADARNIHFNVAGLADRAIVTGDPTRLQQIVWNLLSNAIKFSDPSAAISVTLERAGEEARLVVRDSGRGIHPDFLPHVFEPFRQADGGSTRAYGGLGLGLAIVKYLAELHGGTVSAQSEGLGLGATFTVVLPLASRKTDHKIAITTDEIVDLSGITILLVDDDADTRELVAAILRRFGADVDAAESANIARERLQIKRPHILVSDIAMPEQDGFALLDFLRGLEDQQRPIPAVALTALARPDSDERFRAAGFQACVQKPVDPIEFARIIAGLRA